MPVSFIKRFRSMSQLDSSGSELDLDIDLESGGTSEEDASKILGLKNSKILSGRVCELCSSKSLSECTNGEDCSCSYDKLIISDEISAKDSQQLGKVRQNLINFGHERIDGEKPKKHKSAKLSKPPRPPRGPSLDASDMMLLKEITELNMKRRRMERSRTLKRTKKEKSSSSSTSLFACLLTLIFLLVIIFQGNILFSECLSSYFSHLIAHTTHTHTYMSEISTL
ncbi:hypothetical protein ACS0TY_002306 [Phlomoides rotata]